MTNKRRKKVNKKLISKRNYVLRKVLNTEKNIEIIQNFIESILEIQIKKIQINRYLKEKGKYLPEEENFGIVDCRIQTKDDEQLNVGIQFVDGIYIQTKMLLYYSQIHLNQQEYNDNRKFARTITINLLDFNYFSTPEYEKKINIETNEKNKESKEIKLDIIELPKINLYKNNINKKKEWIIYLEGSNIDEIEKIKQKNKYIRTLDKLLDDYWIKEKME